MSSISTIAQIASPVAQIIFIFVVGAGYWYTARVSYRMIEEMRDERRDMGRPMVIVRTGAERLPEVDLVVQNVGPGPAKGVSFSFSAPLEASDGSVLSRLPIFEGGCPRWSPAKIECYWGDLGDLLPYLRENNGRTADHVTVTVRYTDLTTLRWIRRRCSRYGEWSCPQLRYTRRTGGWHFGMSRGSPRRRPFGHARTRPTAENTTPGLGRARRG